MTGTLEAEGHGTDEAVEAEAVEITDVVEVASQEVAILEERAASTAHVAVLPSPGEWEATLAIANKIARTPFVPSAYRGQPEAVVAAILFGREIGIGPMQALQKIHMIDGKPSLAAELMLAQMRRGGLVIVDSASTAERAMIHARRTDTGEEATVEWTFEEAAAISQKGKRLVEKDNWRNYPADMLWARCVGRLARRIGSDLLGGMVYASEEMADWDEGGYSDTAPAARVPRVSTTDGVPLRDEAPLGFVEIAARMAAVDPAQPWPAWVEEALVALAGKHKVAELTSDELRDCGIRIGNGVAYLQVAMEGREFPPPSRAEIQVAFAHGDSVGEVLAGPDQPLDPDEARAAVRDSADQGQDEASKEGAGPQEPSDGLLGRTAPLSDEARAVEFGEAP